MTIRHLHVPALVVAALVMTGCSSVTGIPPRDFRPIQDPLPPELSAFIDQTPNYRRTEETTYLTFPEWYLVFNPQEYGQFLHQHPPSQFPYFKSIGQLWGSYAEVYGITRRNYPLNFGDHLMLLVISTSSTIEYVFKGVYANTAGRVFEFLGCGARTPEDEFGADVAQEYGAFLPTRPWFEFPYGHKLVDLWTDTAFFGPHFPRKIERKFVLSFEYGVKFLYAGVIRLGSHAVYGVADTEVYASVTNMPDSAFDIPNVKKIKQLGDHSWIITVPHYQGFTETVPVLARLGVQFIEIAGNDEILMSIVVPVAWQYDLAEGTALFSMDVLTGPEFKRVAIQVPVKSLGRILQEVEAKGLTLEHLFDY